mmetsp:Transcript_98815/g.213254  ORF Transcript_98815/g.213254 Transcript_98815/m.213254 type:complete len:869 (+) Transcript_98815:225-2831(+)
MYGKASFMWRPRATSGAARAGQAGAASLVLMRGVELARGEFRSGRHRGLLLAVLEEPEERLPGGLLLVLLPRAAVAGACSVRLHRAHVVQADARGRRGSSVHRALAPAEALAVPLREGARRASRVPRLGMDPLRRRRRGVPVMLLATLVLLGVLEHLDVALAHVLAVQDLLHDGDVPVAGEQHDGLSGCLPVALHDHPDGVPVLHNALDDVVLAEEGVDVLLRGGEGEAPEPHGRDPARRLRGRLGLRLAPLAPRHLPEGAHLLGQGREHGVHGQHARHRHAGSTGRGAGQAGRQAAAALPCGEAAEVHVRLRLPVGARAPAPHHRRRRAGGPAGEAPEVHRHARGGARPVHGVAPAARPLHAEGRAGALGRLRRAVRHAGGAGVPVGAEGLRRAPVAGRGDALGRAVAAARRPVHKPEGRGDLGAGETVVEGRGGIPRVVGGEVVGPAEARCGAPPVLVRDVVDAASGRTSRALVVAVLLLALREVGGQVAVALAAVLHRREEGDALAALGAVHRELARVLCEEVLQPLVGFLQVEAGALRERDAEHAQEELALPRRVHVLAALRDDVLLGDAQGLDVLLVVRESAVRRRGLLEAQLVRALGEQEDLHVALLVLLALRGRPGAGHLHDLHVLRVARRPGGRRVDELHPREARRAAVAVQHQLHGVLGLEVGAVLGPEEGLDVRDGGPVGQPAQLHGGLVGLVLLLLPLLELRERALAAVARRRRLRPRRGAVAARGLRIGGARGSEQERDALLARLAGDLEELRVLLEPAPEAALLLHAVPQRAREQRAEVAQEEGVPLPLPEELHQLREQRRLAEPLVARLARAARGDCRHLRRREVAEADGRHGVGRHLLLLLLALGVAHLGKGD